MERALLVVVADRSPWSRPQLAVASRDCEPGAALLRIDRVCVALVFINRVFIHRVFIDTVFIDTVFIDRVFHRQIAHR